jgi:murein L,D-transpeptidase YafK
MAAGEFLRLIRRPFLRTALITAALTAGLGLSACNTDGTSKMSGRAMAPLSSATLAELEAKNMDKGSPILVRLFKSEAELEVWKKDRSGQFALLKTYPICRWSGDLGPKIKEGDRQAPEGFYTITPAQMNPNSSYYLSFNMGYPNAFDRSLGRTGSNLMIHGDCSSRGCYAMTDEQISEIYALGRESFFGGQKAFQVQAYPFRMTAENMAKHRNSKHMAFWKNIKQGYDHFEVTRQQPRVSVCERRYVFDAVTPDGSPLNASPSAKCPTFEIPQAIASAVNDKQRQDEYKTAQLIAQGVPVAPSRAGIDGGMNRTFAQKLGLGDGNTVQDQSGRSIMLSSASSGITSRVGIVPPTRLPSESPPEAPVLAAETPAPVRTAAAQSNAPVPTPPRRAAAVVPPSAPQHSAPQHSTPQPSAPQKTARSQDSKTLDTLFKTATAETKVSDKPANKPAAASAPAAPKPQLETAAPVTSNRSAYAATNSALSGAQAGLPAASFNSRWSAFR